MTTITITDIGEVRAGDKVTFRTKEADYHAVGETITATAVDYDGVPYVLGYDLGVDQIEFISAERDIPDLPTEYGAYIDRDGAVCVFDMSSGWRWISSVRDEHHPEKYAPFTRLVPETELVEQRKKIAKFVQHPGAATLEELANRIERGEF